jgi:hypothetical protein
MLGRADIGQDVAECRDAKHDFVLFDPRRMLGNPQQMKKLDAAGTVEKLLAGLGPMQVSAGTRQLLEDYLQDDLDSGETFALDQDTLDKKVRGAVAMLLSLPEYQVH